MFFTVLIMPASFDSILYNFFQISFTVRAKASLAFLVLKVAYCTFNNLLSQSVTVSLLARCCVGVEEGRSWKSMSLKD